MSDPNAPQPQEILSYRTSGSSEPIPRPRLPVSLCILLVLTGAFLFALTVLFFEYGRKAAAPRDNVQRLGLVLATLLLGTLSLGEALVGAVALILRFRRRPLPPQPHA